MKWFTSLSGSVATAFIALLVFLGRAFIDFYFVYGEFSLDISMISLTVLAHMALFGGWIWALLAAVQGSRRGLGVSFGFSLFFLLVIAVGTLVSYCPSPCQTGWPLGEIFIWLSLVAGIVACLAQGIHLWQNRSSSALEPA